VAYCDKDDLLTGDIPLAGKYGDGTQFVNLAADEIDAQIGHLYITPVVFVENTPEQIAKVRPSKLLLKKINTLLASGRIVLDMAAGGEDDRLHAYGKSMLDEAVFLLNQISSGKIILIDAPELPNVEDDENTGPSLHNEDPYSLVQGFYDRYSGKTLLPGPPMRPYDELPADVEASP
jgi:hypothetical protein